MVEPRTSQPLVLIASHDEWVGRSVGSVLDLRGYAVAHAANGRRALEIARDASPDALVLDTELGEMGGIEVCRELGADPLFDHATPIFITAPAPASNRVRLEAFEAGAWDFAVHPLDIESVMLKLRTFLRARSRLLEAQSRSMIDPRTGLYSTQGLQHWAAQLGARASRNHEPFACVMVTASAADQAGTGKPVSAELSYMAELCRAGSRKSDVVGYVGDSRFAILAPGTDEAGARQLVDRLQRAIDAGPGRDAEIAGAHPALQAGFYAAADFGASGVDPNDVVTRAETALRHAMGGGSPTLSFDDLPPAR